MPEVVARRQLARRAGRALSRASREGGGQQHTNTGPIRRPCCPERTCPRVRAAYTHKFFRNFPITGALTDYLLKRPCFRLCAMSSAFLIDSKELGFVVETDQDGVQREVYALKNDKPVHVSSRTIARWEQQSVPNGPSLEELKARSPSSRSPSRVVASPRTVLRALEVPPVVDARASDREAASPTSPLGQNAFMKRDSQLGMTSSSGAQLDTKKEEAAPAIADPASTPAAAPPATAEAEATTPAEATTEPRPELPAGATAAADAAVAPRPPVVNATSVTRPDLVVRLPSARMFADFVAEREGELSVMRDEEVLVLPRKAPDGWAVVRRAASEPGMDEGLVPADWLELEGASAATGAESHAGGAGGSTAPVAAAAAAAVPQGGQEGRAEIGVVERQGSKLTRSSSWSKISQLGRRLSWNRRSRSGSNSKADVA